MTLTRREILAGSAALSLMPGSGMASTDVMALEAGPAQSRLAPEGFAKTPVWGYDGGSPGPEIRVSQGARLRRRLINSLPQPTTVHWHGIRIDNAMDGVPGLTQATVPPGGRFDYDFTLPDAGTYWYHSHERSWEQVARGLYGALVVTEPDPPDTDQDLVLLLDDWRLDPDTLRIVDDFNSDRDFSHAGRLGNIMTVNGRFDPAYPVRQNQRLRLRLANCANARSFEVGLDGLAGWLVALDGMPLDQPVAVRGAFELAPAQRADLLVDVTADPGTGASLLSIEPDGGYGLARFPVRGRASAHRRDPPGPLPPNPMPGTGNPAAAPLHRMTMQGGAMRGLQAGTLGGTRLDGRELAALGKFWALNGQVGRPEAPFIDAARGETLRIAYVNDTAFDHAMHLHGHHVRVIAANGVPGPWRDTVMVRAGQTRQVVLVADNPGDWLLHCHMLAHATAGMTSWIRVR